MTKRESVLYAVQWTDHGLRPGGMVHLDEYEWRAVFTNLQLAREFMKAKGYKPRQYTIRTYRLVGEP